MTPANFQAESSRSGAAFEDRVKAHLITLGYTLIDNKLNLKEVGIEIDSVIEDPSGSLVYIEAKGGEAGPGKRPGAQRTDNVKKAIANGALFKAMYPERTFEVWFSARPKKNSSSEVMLNNAIKYGLIDAVNYLE